MKRLTFLFPALLLAWALTIGTGYAQTQTGVVQGKVLDQQGGVLPGVSVDLIGPTGVKSTSTDAQGVYRFVGVSPSAYSVKVNLSGFLAQQRDNVEVRMAAVIDVDFSLKVGGVAETVEVTASSVTVDVKSSSTETTLSSALLDSLPIYSSTSTGLLNAAPGVNSSSAYGGQASYGNALLLDGVDTRDPAGGSPWTFFNQNLIQEVQIGGLGAAAEYGGFTGGIINTVTKSGGNAYSGLFSMRYTTKDLASKNVTDEIIEQNPSLAAADITKSLSDYTVQMGGPIKKDKAFFFGSIQRYSAVYDPSGPRTKSTDISPRFNFKLTLQPTASDTIVFGMQYDQYNVTGRVGYPPATVALDNQTVTEDAPEWVWNAQYRKVFGSSTFLEAKLTGYTGYYYLDSIDPTPVVYDGEDASYTGGGGYLYYADRSRNQVIASLTKYAQAYGTHSFKFGAEIERSHVRSQYGYGPAGFYIYAYGGVPYYQVSFGYDLQGDNRRTSLYAQDQWNVGRLTLNLGLRMDHIRGYSPVLKETVYTPHAAWGPRLGAALDVTGNSTTVLKGFWGRYYEGTATAFFTSATPGIKDLTHRDYLANGQLAAPVVVTPAQVYDINKDINHPKTDEFSVAWEQQFLGNMRLIATGIYRTTSNFVNNVVEGALWRPITLNNGLTGQPYTAYYWQNRTDTQGNFTIRNIEGYQYKAVDGSVISTIDPTRDYKALMLVLNRSFKSRWGYQLSYVLAKATGNVDNTGFGNYLGGHAWVSPNTGAINNRGELTNSRRHEIKAYFTYQIPRIEVMLSPAYTGLSGRPYTAYAQPGSSTLNIPGSSTRRQIFLEPRGTEINDFAHYFDLRAEKYFRVEGYRLGLYADIVNLFNSSAITGRQTRHPSTTISGNTVLYRGPTSVQGARQITFGARFMF